MFDYDVWMFSESNMKCYVLINLLVVGVNSIMAPTETSDASGHHEDDNDKVGKAKRALTAEMESFRKLQNKMVDLEETLREAADNTAVDQKQLKEINNLLVNMDREVVKPMGNKLLNYQTNLLRNLRTKQ